MSLQKRYFIVFFSSVISDYKDMNSIFQHSNMHEPNKFVNYNKHFLACTVFFSGILVLYGKCMHSRENILNECGLVLSFLLHV